MQRSVDEYRRLYQRAVSAGALGPLGQTRVSTKTGELTEKSRPSKGLFKFLQPKTRQKPKKTETKKKSKESLKTSTGSKAQQEPPEAKKLRQLMWNRYEQENGS